MATRRFFDGAQEEIGSLPIIQSAAPPAEPTLDSIFWIRIGGVWRKTITRIRVNGTWMKAHPVTRVDGEWKFG